MGLLPNESGQMVFDDTRIEGVRAEERALLASTDGLKTVLDFVYDLFPVLKDMLKRRGGDLLGG
jgi:urea transport system ATP-binding protein